MFSFQSKTHEQSVLSVPSFRFHLWLCWILFNRSTFFKKTTAKNWFYWWKSWRFSWNM